jgi:hypothetical protein
LGLATSLAAASPEPADADPLQTEEAQG